MYCTQSNPNSYQMPFWTFFLATLGTVRGRGRGRVRVRVGSRVRVRGRGGGRVRASNSTARLVDVIEARLVRQRQHGGEAARAHVLEQAEELGPGVRGEGRVRLG